MKKIKGPEWALRRFAERKALRDLPPLERRRRAAQAAKDKFLGVPLDWRSGQHCIKMAHWHLRQMGMRPPALPRVASAAEAKRALQARGWDSVTAMFDALLERIAPAMMLPGDIAVTPGTDGLDCAMISLGGKQMLGFLTEGYGVQFEEGGRVLTGVAVVWEVDMTHLSAAWRVRAGQ